MTGPDVIPALTSDEQRALMKLAREAVVAAATECPPPQPDLDSLPPALKQSCACFVTLNKGGALRGCTGTLVATRPLALEVVHSAVQTATSDPRFGPVSPHELDALEIEISILSASRPLQFDDPADLPKLIRPGVDGVTLYCGGHRATFLPQVWERIPDPEDFLAMLCRKMSLPALAWKLPGVAAEIYQTAVLFEADLGQE